MAFVATGCAGAGADAAHAALAQALGVLVSVAGRPDLCDPTTPASVDRDPVALAIGRKGLRLCWRGRSRRGWSRRWRRAAGRCRPAGRAGPAARLLALGA